MSYPVPVTGLVLLPQCNQNSTIYIKLKYMNMNIKINNDKETYLPYLIIFKKFNIKPSHHV